MPFDTSVKSIEQVPLTEEEKKIYRDVNGKEPMGKYRIFLSEDRKAFTGDVVDFKKNKCGILEDEVILRVQNCLKQLSKCNALEKEEVQFYIGWKKKVKQYIGETIELLGLEE